jgi:hypothetical protein
MEIYYRISDNSYSKNRIEWATKRYCLENFVTKFKNENITIISDSVSDETMSMIYNFVSEDKVIRTNFGHGALSFNFCLNQVNILSDDTIVYFVEDDYLHRDGSVDIIKDGLNFVGANFVSLYDHPDKYLNPSEGGNPNCSNRSEPSRVYLGDMCHYKMTNSTTMTFAARVSSIKYFFPILNKWTLQRHPSGYPYDYYMFLELIQNGATVVTPLPSYSTHIETHWLAPLIDWSSV